MIKLLSAPIAALFALLATGQPTSCSEFNEACHSIQETFGNLTRPAGSGSQPSDSSKDLESYAEANKSDSERKKKDKKRSSNTTKRPSKTVVVDTLNPTPLMAKAIPGEVILNRAGYVCSYNPSTLQPNYVAWSLTPAKLRGTEKRDKSFYEDPDIEYSKKPHLDDYYNSGFDRGHMCPAADNKWSKSAMHDCFYLSNMSPQTHTLNAGDWEQLETACRSWVTRGSITAYIVSGPIFESKQPRKINRRIPVPDKYFKAIVCVDKGKEKGIAFIYGNNTEEHPMSYYVCTIDEVEKITGYDLFHTLDNKLEATIESQSNLSDWSRHKK